MLFEQKTNEVFDALQNARLVLYKNFSPVLIELIQPVSEKSFTWNSLQKNGEHFNHFCYEVDNMEVLNSYITRFRLIKVMDPIPALLFENRYVCFYYTRTKQVVEFIINNYEN